MRDCSVTNSYKAVISCCVLITYAKETLHQCKHFFNKIYLIDVAHFECCYRNLKLPSKYLVHYTGNFYKVFSGYLLLNVYLLLGIKFKKISCQEFICF